ncbi:MAG: nucleoside hydrolase [Streptosporangiales bacterium]|nr:nucleoside hydrolase [Streptosporangiales bacterium]
MTTMGEDGMAQDRQRVVLDTDGGVDDLAALWFLATHSEVDLLAVVATAGARPASLTARNAILLLDLVERPDVPVVLGGSGPIGPVPGIAPVEMHGAEGLGSLRPWEPSRGPVRATAEELLTDLTAREPATLITTGPLSTAAALIDTAVRLNAPVVMGGVIRRAGNALPRAEANIARDPSAAAQVVGHPWPSPGRLVPLDVTMTTTLGPAELAALEVAGTAGATLRRMLDHYRSYAPDPGNFPCHDLFTAMLAVEPSLAAYEPLPLRVDTGESAAWGMTVADLRPARTNVSAEQWPTWQIATHPDTHRFRAALRQAAIPNDR